MSFFRSKPDVAAPAKRVWRISQTNPLGEWVESVPPAIAKPHSSLAQRPNHAPINELPEVSYGSWVTSSYDLLDGSDVTEDPDTLPGELLDDLFPQWAQVGKRPDLDPDTLPGELLDDLFPQWAQVGKRPDK